MNNYKQMIEERLASSLDPELQERYKQRRAQAIEGQKQNFQNPEAIQALGDGERTRALISGLTRAANKFGSVGGDGGPKSDIGETMGAFNEADRREFGMRQNAFDRAEKAEDGANSSLNEQADRGVKLAGMLDTATRTDVARGREDAEYTRKSTMQESEDDSASDVSRSYQALAARMVPGRDYSTLSASKLKSLLPSLESLYKVSEASAAKREAATQWRRGMEASREDREAARADAAADRAAARQEAQRQRDADYERRRQDKLEDDRKTNSAKANKDDEEFNQRFDNINKNLTDLDAMVEQNGTFELFGPESAHMDKRLYDIALDYAKIVDPASVAREGEVAAAQKYLLPIKGLGVRNSTAKQHIQDMRETLRGRMSAKNANRMNTQNSAGMSDAGGFPRTVKNAQGATATVANEAELKEANGEGFR